MINEPGVNETYQRTPVIWQPDEMTCYESTENVNAAGLVMIFSRTVLIADRMPGLKHGMGYIRLQRIFVHQVRHQQEVQKSNIAYLIYTTF